MIVRDNVLYTAILGDYDEPYAYPLTDIPGFLFTDNPSIRAPRWNIVLVEKTEAMDARIRHARDIKINYYKYLPPHRVSIWIDANLRLNGSPIDAKGYLSDCEIATFKYPDTYGPRNCAYEEANACIARGKDDPLIISEQIARYREVGFSRNEGLVETSFLIRRNNIKVYEFCSSWWSEVLNGSRRDQISFNYVAWKHQLRYAIVPGSRISNRFSIYHSHKSNT